MINAENVNCWFASAEIEPVSNVSLVVSNLTTPESKVSNAVRLKSLLSVWSAVLVLGTIFSEVIVRSGAAIELFVMVASVAVQSLAIASGLLNKFAPAIWPVILDVKVLACTIVCIFVGLLYQSYPEPTAFTTPTALDVLPTIVLPFAHCVPTNGATTKNVVSSFHSNTFAYAPLLECITSPTV